jgi:hypothetical protein
MCCDLFESPNGMLVAARKDQRLMARRLEDGSLELKLEKVNQHDQ